MRNVHCGGDAQRRSGRLCGCDCDRNVAKRSVEFSIHRNTEKVRDIIVRKILIRVCVREKGARSKLDVEREEEVIVCVCVQDGEREILAYVEKIERYMQ